MTDVRFVVDGWKFTTESGAWKAIDPRDESVSVSISEDGCGVHIQDATRYYPGGAYSIPWLVLDKLRELDKAQ